jgi:Ca2+-binding EF-hand superfamily protein
MAASRAEEINNKFLEIINSRSGGGILGLGRSFRIIDVDRSGQLSLAEFKVALNKFRVGLKNDEVEILFSYYDKDNSGALRFDEFLRGLRSQMSPQRRALTEQAFNAMDTDGSGELTYEDLKSKYDVSKHPKVRSGDWTPKQAIDDFLKVFEGEGGDKNSVVTKQEFMDYYIGISSNIDLDDAFGIMMANNWGIEYIPQANVQRIMEIIRTKAAQKGGNKNPKRVALDVFKHFDTNNTKSIDFQEFCKAMESFSSGLNAKELQTLFRMFDHDGSGEIEYGELVNLVFDGKA